MICTNLKTQVVGVDISLDKTSCAVIDVRGNILATTDFPTTNYPMISDYVSVLCESILNLVENNGGYDPMEIFNSDPDIRKVLMQLINGTYSPDDPERFRHLYNSLLNTESTSKADTYFILKDFKSYAEAQKKVEKAYMDEKKWAKMSMLNVACSGKFTSDRTIQQYVDEIWHLDKVVLK